MSKKPIELIEEKFPTPSRADRPPTEGYSLEVDGKLKTQFATTESALEAGTVLKRRFPFLQVKIYDAKEKTRTPIDISTA